MCIRRLFWLLLAMFIFTGCNEQIPPSIDYSSVDAPPPRNKIILPPPLPPKPAPHPAAPSAQVNAPTGWMPSHSERAWSAIIVHHSATDNGNATIIDKWHRENNGWNGVGYDFVIGNGSDSGDGQVEPTYRWRGQLTGAHTGGTPGNWANEEAIGICLVGDFDRNVPSKRQLESLAKLVRFLQQRYHIPKSRVYGHGSTPGGHVTDCPGKRFPMKWLKSNIN